MSGDTKVFRTAIRIRFGDEDHAQVVYHPRLFHFFHVALEEFFEHRGLPYRKVLEQDRLGFPVVHAEADFREPLRFGETLEIEVRVASMGRTSLAFDFVGWRDGRQAARARLVTACIDRDTWTSRPIPEAYRTAFEGAREGG